MKTTSQLVPLKKCGQLRAACAMCAISLLVTLGAHAQTVWYLQGDMQSGQNYNAPGYWYSAPTGGAAATSLSASDIYDTNGYAVRTTETPNTSTFGGGQLRLNGGATAMLLKGANATVSNLTVTSAGGSIRHAQSGLFTLNVTTFNVAGPMVLDAGITAAAAKTIAINATTLSGSGNISVVAALFGGLSYGEIRFNVGNAASYSGNIGVTNGARVNFLSSFGTGGALILDTGSRFMGTTGNITFASLNIAGTTLGQGVYDYAALSAVNATIFANSFAGTVTVVPEPSAWMLIGAAGIFFVLKGARMAVRRRSVV